MTRDEIMGLLAGSEMDAIVAEKVMGWQLWATQRGEYVHLLWQTDYREPWKSHRDWEAHVSHYTPMQAGEIDPYKHVMPNTPKFSTDIGAAWKVVEKFDFLRVAKSFGTKGVVWIVKVDGDAEVFCESAPLAICRAALLASVA